MKDYSISLYIVRKSHLLSHPTCTPVNLNHRGYFNTSTRFSELIVFKKKKVYNKANKFAIFLSPFKREHVSFLKTNFKILYPKVL